MQQQNLTKHLKENQDRLIIFGAGYFGDRILKTLQLNEITPYAICDNNAERVGGAMGGVPIRSLVDIIEEKQNFIFLISPYEVEFSTEIIAQLHGLDLPILEYYTLKEFFIRIQTIAFESVYERLDFALFLNAMYKKQDEENLYESWIELNITERCSLKCKDCSNLMPYYENPKHHDTKDILASIDRLDETFASITRLMILGGEPLMHPDVFEIMVHAQTKAHIHFTVLVTNGMFLPKKEDLLKLNPNKTLVRISNYGEYSTKKEPLMALLEEVGLTYNLDAIEEWNDSATIEFRNKDVAGVKKTFERCCTAFPEIVDGKLFWCPFLAATYRLHAIPKDEIEYIDILDTSKTPEELKKIMRHYLYDIETLKGCNWCRGRSRAEIAKCPPAIQVKERLPYKRYDD